MANPLETTGEDMEQEPAEEFDRVEGHGARLIAPLGIFPSEGDFPRVAGQQAPMRDGYPMRVPRQVPEHLLGPGQGGLGIDDPFRLSQRGEKLSPRGRRRESLTRPMATPEPSGPRRGPAW